MKQIFIILLICTSTITFSQTQREANEMQLMMEAMTPNENHKILAAMEGEWNYTWKMYMPGAPPMESTGILKNTMILGSRFLQMENKGPGVMGMPYEALSIFGYDNRSKKFTMFGVDTWGTYSVYAEGDYDAASKTFRLSGEDSDPRINKTQIFEFIFRMTDANNMRTELLFVNEEGGWDLVMEFDAVRK
ncbi:MAG: DUF1579 domain-containing protein [Fimbriimonadaceae bacterium]|nr:DUF1579 domain-containing protein [Chitinophagales bacterium]